MKHNLIPAYLLSFLLLLPFAAASAQPLKTNHAGDLKQALKKLNVLGTALYMAAHPDDENTAMLAYLAKERLVRTAYLSITRGDGGQNLIGPEQAELMGLIRTQELLQARRIDGAEQFFTRANDFGFSKSTEEALELWGHEKILGDAVWVIRNVRPDVIITRFPTTAQAGHGQHSASSVLAEEAFVAAADPKRFPEQLKWVKPWQAKRIVWNSYNPGFTNTPPEGPNFISANIGSFNPLLGKSYTEIAGESRSMHKSQGFGSARSKGSRIDYFKHTAGEPARNDLFDDIDLTWKRVKGGETISALFAEAYQTFNAENPSAILPLLINAYTQLQKFPADDYYVQLKKKEVADLIVACSGLWFEANAHTFAGTQGSTMRVNATVVKRSEAPVRLVNIKVLHTEKDTIINKDLKNNEALNLPVTVSIPAAISITQPYWLVNPWDKGMYVVKDLQLIGKPEKEPELTAEFHFLFNETPFTLTSPIQYRWVDPVEGELYRGYEVRPAVMVNLTERVYMFPDKEAKDVTVWLKAGKANIKGEVTLDLPKGWKVSPASVPFTLLNNEEEQRYTFQVTPPANTSDALLKAIVKTADGQTLTRGIRTIEYKHIPQQTLFPEAQARAVRLDVKTAGKNIAYIMGPGDDVPAALRQIGYSVVMLTESDLQADVATLARYDAIVVGVRAYNTNERLKFYNPKLLQYVENGGTLVVQYTVNQGLVTNQIGPYPFELSRNRVTVEDAPVTFLNPQHLALNAPNKITNADFEGWVQERGLYFAQKWDPKYQTVLATNDPKEEKQEGGLLIATHGKGKFVFTGYAFFRQLPAGVPGAYRLFANLLAK
jgi:LmbE family N-acetylglucosaminyl deacetylase